MARRVGIAPTWAGFGGPCIACLPPPRLEKFTFYHPRAQRRPHHHTLSPESCHICHALCPWMADRPLMRIDLPIKNEHRYHARDEVEVTRSLASYPQVFHGGCFGVYGTPPREAVWFCEIGTKIPLVPRLGVRTLRIRWLSWLTFGWRVQTCVQVLAWCLKTAPPGVCLAAWPRCRLQSMPGFFRAVRG
jgi:hypothetical protein